MVRKIVFALGIALVLCGIGFYIAGGSPWPALMFGVLLVIGTIFDRRYNPAYGKPPGGWEKTGERFVDPTTGQLTDVFYDPTTGERSYRPVQPNS